MKISAVQVKYCNPSKSNGSGRQDWFNSPSDREVFFSDEEIKPLQNKSPNDSNAVFPSDNREKIKITKCCHLTENMKQSLLKLYFRKQNDGGKRSKNNGIAKLFEEKYPDYVIHRDIIFSFIKYEIDKQNGGISTLSALRKLKNGSTIEASLKQIVSEKINTFAKKWHKAVIKDIRETYQVTITQSFLKAYANNLVKSKENMDKKANSIKNMGQLTVEKEGFLIEKCAEVDMTKPVSTVPIVKGFLEQYDAKIAPNIVKSLLKKGGLKLPTLRLSADQIEYFIGMAANNKNGQEYKTREQLCLQFNQEFPEVNINPAQLSYYLNKHKEAISQRKYSHKS